MHIYINLYKHEYILYINLDITKNFNFTASFVKNHVIEFS